MGNVAAVEWGVLDDLVVDHGAHGTVRAIDRQTAAIQVHGLLRAANPHPNNDRAVITDIQRDVSELGRIESIPFDLQAVVARQNTGNREVSGLTGRSGILCPGIRIDQLDLCIRDPRIGRVFHDATHGRGVR